MQICGTSCRLPVILLTHFALKKDFVLDGQTFRLKSGGLSKVSLPVGYRHYEQLMIEKFFDIFFCLKKLISSSLSQSQLQISIRSAMMKMESNGCRSARISQSERSISLEVTPAIP